jgi:hypothetical protein
MFTPTPGQYPPLSGVRMSPFEIRPAADLSGMIRDSEQRRGNR